MTVNTRKIKTKKCRICKCQFAPRRPMQPVCDDFACKVAYAEQVAAKAKRKREKIERAADKEKREALKSLSDHIKETQVIVNRYIRERDRDEPCISCGRFHGGQWHAGHYLPTSARPELRFDPLNIHKQCQPCNTMKHGNSIPYRINLVDKIGIKAVAWLEGPHEAARYRVEDLKAIQAEFKQKLKDLLEERRLHGATADVF